MSQEAWRKNYPGAAWRHPNEHILFAPTDPFDALIDKIADQVEQDSERDFGVARNYTFSRDAIRQLVVAHVFNKR